METTIIMDIPRFYTALAEWGACLLSVLILPPRITGWKRRATILGALIVFILYHGFAGTLPLFLWIPGMTCAILLMYGFLLLTCNVNWKDVGFCCAHAFVLAEFTASIHWQVYVWCVSYFHTENKAISVVTMLLTYILIDVIYYLMARKSIPDDEPMEISTRELISCILIALSAFAISNLSFISPNTPFSGISGSILYIRTLVDFGGLVVLFSLQALRSELRMQNENRAMNLVLQHQYEQYRLSIDNTELLRKEFHDLKHYMIAIRAEENPQKKEQYLMEMEEAIRTQEAFANTNNSVLDVVLTTKSIYCAQNNIRFTCMADGQLISFMHVKDICSIFGNALDNAIECVSQFEESDKRLITLSMYQKNQLLMIQCENYTETSLTLQPGKLPSTTKKDAFCHGYGLKSIRQVAEKYGGSMTIQAKDHWFTLKVLIPIK
ncbi:ATP-binding protein [Bariatricus sp. SGI.154]|uniref:ATP-binding protein n=1 Tax=Bariatricus sp. SGI.154 TaxID=3420549 RepID=UPI003D03CB32